MTQVGEGQEAEETAPPVVTFGAPTAGEVLAERYELVEHINNDSAGRLVWPTGWMPHGLVWASHPCSCTGLRQACAQS